MSSSGAIGTLQEWGEQATSRLQHMLSADGAGLADLLGTSRIANSPQFKALVDIGGVLADRVTERVATGKEVQAIKEIGEILLRRVVVSVQEVAEEMGDSTGKALSDRLQHLGSVTAGLMENTGLTKGVASLAESAMGMIGDSRSRR